MGSEPLHLVDTLVEASTTTTTTGTTGMHAGLESFGVNWRLGLRGNPGNDESRRKREEEESRVKTHQESIKSQASRLRTSKNFTQLPCVNN